MMLFVFLIVYQSRIRKSRVCRLRDYAFSGSEFVSQVTAESQWMNVVFINVIQVDLNPF